MDWTRRELLAVGTAGVVLAGCIDGSEEAERADDDSDGELREAMAEYDPDDYTDRDAVEILVAPGGEPGFEPEAILVESTTRIRWIWETGGYDLRPVDVPDPRQWDGVEQADEGDVHEWGFPFEGTYVVESASDDGRATGAILVVDSEEGDD